MTKRKAAQRRDVTFKGRKVGWIEYDPTFPLGAMWWGHVDDGTPTGKSVGGGGPEFATQSVIDRVKQTLGYTFEARIDNGQTEEVVTKKDLWSAQRAIADRPAKSVFAATITEWDPEGNLVAEHPVWKRKERKRKA